MIIKEEEKMEITNNNHETLDDKLFSNRIIPIFGEITNEII